MPQARTTICTGTGVGGYALTGGGRARGVDGSVLWRAGRSWRAYLLQRLAIGQDASEGPAGRLIETLGQGARLDAEPKAPEVSLEQPADHCCVQGEIRAAALLRDIDEQGLDVVRCLVACRKAKHHAVFQGDPGTAGFFDAGNVLPLGDDGGGEAILTNREAHAMQA